MKSILHLVQLQLNHLTKLGLIADYGINGIVYKEEDSTTVSVNNRELPLYSAYWYLQGMIDAQNLGN